MYVCGLQFIKNCSRIAGNHDLWCGPQPSSFVSAQAQFRWRSFIAVCEVLSSHVCKPWMSRNVASRRSSLKENFIKSKTILYKYTVIGVCVFVFVFCLNGWWNSWCNELERKATCGIVFNSLEAKRNTRSVMRPSRSRVSRVLTIPGCTLFTVMFAFVSCNTAKVTSTFADYET